jgi:hypothetical protein
MGTFFAVPMRDHERVRIRFVEQSILCSLGIN